MGNKFLLYGGFNSSETKRAMDEARRRSIYSVIPPISRASAEAPAAPIGEVVGDPIIAPDGTVGVVVEMKDPPKQAESDPVKPKEDGPADAVREIVEGAINRV